jgi:hypothetical protein
MILPPEPPKPYRRSPFQVAVLMFATGGFYVFWWAFFARRWCAATLERDDQPLWKAVALIIPIFNLFLIFDLAQMIGGTAWRAGLREGRGRFGLGLVGLAFAAVTATWRLPDSYWVFSILDFVPLAWLQLVLVRSALTLQGPAALPSRFHWIEWAVIAAGSVFVFLNFAAPLLPWASPEDMRAPWFRIVVLAVATIALAWFWRASRTLSAPPTAAATAV